MNIIIADDSQQSNAMYFIRLALARAISTLNNNVILWDINKQSAFDAFDTYNPDIIFLQSYNLNSSVLKCIKERPNLMVVMRVSDWSPWRDKLDPKYPVLKAGEKEIKLMEELQKLPNKLVCHIHHFEEYLEMTHGNWIKNGYKIISVPNCADIFDYLNGQYNSQFASDIAWIGAYWKYKGINLDKFIKPLCSPKEYYNIKIFGHGWNIPQSFGFLPQGMEKHILKSAKITPAVHESHSTDFGYDLLTREFNLLCNKCFVVSDYVEGLVKIFPDSIIHCKTPKEFKDQIDYYLDKPEERERIANEGFKEVIEKHTAFDRIRVIWESLGLDTDLIDLVKRQILEKLCN